MYGPKTVKGELMKKRSLAVAVVSMIALAALALVPAGRNAAHAGSAIHPTVSDYQFITSSETPPTQTQCASVGRRCFSPQAVQAAYDMAPLYAAGLNGTGITIAIVDSYGSDTIAHDLHVYDQAFGLQPM